MKNKMTQPIPVFALIGALFQLQAQAANLCTGVVCVAYDQCHVAGVCNPATGLCSNPTATDGTACNDGNACTQTDVCQSGVCVGGNPVVCNPLDQCHVAGVCNPATGTCSNPTAANGTACNDGNACTLIDVCESGVCTGGNPVVCHALDQCHRAGVCNPATGMCSNPAATDGTACNDGNACTQTDVCQSGVCVGGNPVVCNALDQCHVAGVCDPTTGMCSNPTAANGTACNDGNACTLIDVCESGVCTGGNPVVCAVGTCNPATGQCVLPSPTITDVNNGITISWPSAGGYTLEQSSDLAAKAGWTTNSYSISTSNGTNSINILQHAGNLFFRLIAN
jgi:hypothetical protein